jgi:hypothetical protein
MWEELVLFKHDNLKKQNITKLSNFNDKDKIISHGKKKRKPGIVRK